MSIEPDDVAWGPGGLAPAIVQNAAGGAVLMLGWMNAESLARTLESGQVWFYSRSRQKLWRKGETSGNTLAVADVRLDCDRDAILVRAHPAGPTCHTGTTSCFFRPAAAPEDDGPAGHALGELARTLEARRGADPDASYTARLLSKGAEAIAAKLTEEAGELGQAIAGESDERVASEAADLIYHLLVGLLSRDVAPAAVWRELEKRAGTSGLVEKARRGGGTTGAG